MRQTKTLVVMTCDAHDGDVEAEATVSFSVGATSYEMELCADHMAQFDEAIGRWTALARPIPTRRRRAPTTADDTGNSHGANGSRGSEDSDRAGDDMEAIDWAAVRSWAISQGYEVSTRGRVARDVLDAYLAAQHTQV